MEKVWGIKQGQLQKGTLNNMELTINKHLLIWPDLRQSELS